VAAIVWMDEWQQACCGEPVTGSVRSIRAVLSRPGPGGSAPVIEDIWTLEDYAPPDGKLCLVGYLVELNVRPGT
jgi:hypothetical protein